MHQNLCEGSQLSFWQLNLFTFTDSVGYILVSLFIQEGFFLFWKHTLSWKHIRLRFPFFFCFWYESSCERRCQFFLFFFYKVFFPQQKPFSCVVPQKNSQSAIHSARWKWKKKRKKEKKGKKTRASGETVKTLDQLAVAHSSKDQPQALGVLINILDMSKEEKQCVLFY